MATPEEDKTTEKEKQVKAAQSLEEIEKRSVQDTVENLKYTRDITQELEDQLGIKSKLAVEDRSLRALSNEVLKSARENNLQLRESGKLEARIVNDQRIRVGLLAEQKILEKQAGAAGVEAAQKIAELNRQRLSLENQILEAAEKIDLEQDTTKKIALQEKLNNLRGEEVSIEDELIQASKDLSPEAGRLSLTLQLLDALENISEQRIKELENQDKVNDALGITGSLLDNINKVGLRAFGGLGLNLGAFGIGLRKAKEEADIMAKRLALTEAGEGLSNFEKKTKVIGAALPGIKKAVLSAFSDPLTIAVTVLGRLWEAFKLVDKEATSYQRNTGVALDRQNLLSTRLITSVDYIKQASALMEEIGLRADLVFSKDMIAAGAELVNKLGLSNQEAAKLSVFSKATGTNLDKNVEGIVSTVNQFNRANRTALNHGQILKEVAKTSDGISASMGGSVNKIAAAASAAKRLGLELKDIDAIANSLLDFESSIEAELEAQLLTGKDINLNKARELALANDLEGVGKEIFKNSADLFEYGSYNRIQQEAYAKSLGLSRDQLAKIAYQRAIESELTGEALEKATGLTAEEMKRMEVTQSIAKSMEKLAQAFAPVLSVVASIVSFMAEWSNLIATIVGGYATMWTLSKGIAIYQAAMVAKAGTEMALKRSILLLEKQGLGVMIAKGVAWAFLNPGKAVLGAIAAVSAGALLYNITKPKQIDDGVIDPNGGLLVSTPEGKLEAQLNKNDRLFAGTKLGEGTAQNSSINGTGGSERFLQQTLQETRRLVSLMEALNNKNTNIMLDGNKVNVSLALSDSKNA